MQNYNTLKPYIHRQIEDWATVVSKDYISFERKYINFIKRVCKAHNYELAKFSPNHYEFSCFVKGNNKFAYISISDVRYFKNEWFNNILIRTAEHDRDYHGGFNQHTRLPELESKLVNMLG